MELEELKMQKRETSLLEKTKLLSKYSNIYKKICPKMRKLTNEEYQDYLKSIKLGNKDARINLLNAMLVNIYNALSNIYVNYDIKIPFEENMSVAYEVYYDRIMKSEEFPKSISHLTASAGKTLYYRISQNDILYRKHNIDLDFKDIESDVDSIKINENYECYESIFDKELNKILISQIDEISQTVNNVEGKYHKKVDYKQAVLDYFGILDGDVDKSLKTIAKVYDVTPQRIRQIIVTYLRNLREIQYTKYTKEFLIN